MFCACMITGGVYGTGIHFDRLTADHRVKAMMVCLSLLLEGFGALMDPI